MIDLPVAINFFARPDTLQKTMACIRESRPSRLYLIADGPRDYVPTDADNCANCRRLAEGMIDWKCEVIKIYNDKNKGLFQTYFNSMAIVFQNEEYCVFMEDDVIVSPSFFPYCKELLERYKDDLRISFVSGINSFKEGVHPYLDSSYFFSGEGALYAYGLWRRTFNNMNMCFLESHYSVEASKKRAKLIKPGYERRIEKYEKDLLWQGHIPHVEIYKNLFRIIDNQICIVPSKNLVKNIGLSGDSTHTADDIRKIPHSKHHIYTTPVYDLDFPLLHPKCVIDDVDYNNRINYLTAWNRPFLQFLRRLESLVRHLIFGDIKRIITKFKLVLTGQYVFDE